MRRYSNEAYKAVLTVNEGDVNNNNQIRYQHGYKRKGGISERKKKNYTKTALSFISILFIKRRMRKRRKEKEEKECERRQISGAVCA